MTGFCLIDRSERITERLLGWFDSRERDVPWRNERDPYRIWVAEVMAQQTRMETVGSYYSRFISRFPTADALAAAHLDEVLKVWEGLGYYARARHLHAAAGQLVERHGGRLPASVEQLRALKGVGPYTAGAVASMAFGIAEPAVDGNARRVFSRLFDLETPDPARLDVVARRLLEAAPDRPAAVNQAIMDLGGGICTPRNPDCLSCPVANQCQALAEGTVSDRPPGKTRKPTPRRYACSAIVSRDDRVLLVRRPANGLLGGLWDFPGTTPRDDAGSSNEALVGELAETYGVETRLGEPVETVLHTFSHFRLELGIWKATWTAGEPVVESGWTWAATDELRKFAFPTYLRSIIPSLLEQTS